MNLETNNFACPQCGSSSTEKASVAHRKSIRHGRDFSTISEHGKSLEAPEARDERTIPSIVAIFTIGLVWFYLPSLLADIEVKYPLDILDWQHVLVSCVFGWLAGLCIAWPRIKYNVFELPQLEADWQTLMLCHRCDSRFHSDTLKK